ncbi:PTR2-domain-containing protein [Mycena indigotica]|uniref:PTR2-domain-containing protein n=1 Tax=Mycena indigotica TaxID=2126181 RepID=A0A8H6S9H2_9AGAR|nr:PTR2-domain-containing protein [Mycena indigotica]KAF7294596.1 PTR2-domain-containing protein [Mycena indigotica]
MASQTVVTDYETGGPDVKGVLAPNEDKKSSLDGSDVVAELEHGEGRLPTEEERATLRLVSGPIPWAAYLICLVEFAERASYYGCTGVFANFIQRPLPLNGNGAGAPPRGTQATAGALGMGLVAATGITKTFSFLAYTLPILGGIMADTKWGRFKTIAIGTAIGAVAHIVMVISAIPSVIQGGHALGPFILSVLLLALGTGFIKACIAPIIADQSVVHVQSVKTLPTGEKVIIDPGATIQSMLMVYYWSVNVGAFFSVATSYSEKRIGFWLAYLLPGILYILMPITLVVVYSKLVRLPPQGSVVLDSFKVFKTLHERAGFKGMMKGGDNWNVAKPSNIEAAGGLKTKKAGWITWDDEFVDELKRTIVACKLFLFLPIFSLADDGLGTIQNNQGASLRTDGAPNDLLGNFNALTIIFATPLLNFVVYPWLRKIGINFSPIRRIVAGFLVAALAMATGAIIQWRIYETSPCGYYASDCSIGTGVSPISVWVQIPLYSLPAIGELFVNVTSYEIAYTRAPQRMKGVIFAIVLFMSALSSALTLIISPSFVDPNLIWPFVGLGAVCVVAAVLIWILFHEMDDEEAEVLAIGASRKIEGIVRPGESAKEKDLQ